MTQFNIGSTLIQANNLVASPNQNIPHSVTRGTVALVDTDGQWGSSPDPTRHITQWGIQLSRDNGSTWTWWLFQVDLAFGTRSKSGSMPTLDIISTSDLEQPNTRARLAIQTDAQIRLGASIELT